LLAELFVNFYCLATDVVTVFIFHEPSLLSSLQDSGLTWVVLRALVVKDVSERNITKPLRLGTYGAIFKSKWIKANDCIIMAKKKVINHNDNNIRDNL